MAWELDQLADVIDRLRRLNADLRRTADPEAQGILSRRQRLARLEVIASFQAVRIAAEPAMKTTKNFYGRWNPLRDRTAPHLPGVAQTKLDPNARSR